MRVVKPKRPAPAAVDVEREHFAHEMRHLRGAGAHEGAYALGFECRGASRLADEADERADDLAFDLVDGVGRRDEPLDPLGGGGVLMLEERRVRVLDGGIDDLGVGFDHVRGDGLVGRDNERRERGLELGGPSDPRHQLRYGHRAPPQPSLWLEQNRFGLYRFTDRRWSTEKSELFGIMRTKRAGPRSAECRAACSARTAPRA